MKKPDIKIFGEHTIHTRCDAFFREDFFGDLEWAKGVCKGRKVPCESSFDSRGHYYREFYPDYSCKKDHPKLIEYGRPKGDKLPYIQGIFNYLDDSMGELYLACSYFAEIGEEYYVFFSHSIHKSEKYGEQDHYDWCIWTPNTKHFNKRKKEVV